MVDLMMWLTGERPHRVAAFGNAVCSAGTRFKYHDYQASTFQFASPLIGRITANFGCAHPHQHVLRVFGTRGTFVNDDRGPRVSLSRDRSLEPLDLPALPASKGDLIPGFVDRILRGDDAESETRHECDVISACIAADCAARQGEPFDVEYV